MPRQRHIITCVVRGEAEHEPVRMGRKIRQFIDDDRSSHDMVREVLWRLQDRTNELQKVAKRDYTLLTLSALGFELINRGFISEASAAGVKLAKLSFLRYALPVVAAYFFLHLVATVADRDLTQSAYYRLADLAFPGFSQSALDQLLISTSAQVFNVTPQDLTTPASHRMIVFLEGIEAVLAAFVLPVGFSVYAVVQLFRSSSPPYTGAFISAGLTTALLLAAYLFHTRFKHIPS